MIAVKAIYENGQISFSEPIPENIKKAKLTVVIEPDDLIAERETDFSRMGIVNFFGSDDDRQVDWEDHFGIKQQNR